MKKNAVQKIPQQTDDIPLDFSWSGTPEKTPSELWPPIETHIKKRQK